MKTPREILLERHEIVVPKLDAIRHEIIREGRRVAVPKFRIADTATLPILIWRELIFPCRRIWMSLAAIWILIFIFNFSQRDNSQTTLAKSSPSPEMMITFRDQQKWLDELLADRSLPVDVERPRIFSPKPRTETDKFSLA
jgi:hypothetical protein